MNKYLYVQQPIGQTLPARPPSPLPVFFTPFHSHSRSARSKPSTASSGHCMGQAPTRAQDRRPGRGLAEDRVGGGVSFHISLFSKPGAAAGGGTRSGER